MGLSHVMQSDPDSFDIEPLGLQVAFADEDDDDDDDKPNKNKNKVLTGEPSFCICKFSACRSGR